MYKPESSVPLRMYFVNYNTSNLGVLRTNCKFVQQDDIYAVLDDPFNTTKEDGIYTRCRKLFVDLYTTRSLYLIQFR